MRNLWIFLFLIYKPLFNVRAWSDEFSLCFFLLHIINTLYWQLCSSTAVSFPLYVIFIIQLPTNKANLFSDFAAYVGLATIAGFIWWFLYSDDGPKLPYRELVRLLEQMRTVGIKKEEWKKERRREMKRKRGTKFHFVLLYDSVKDQSIRRSYSKAY